MKCFEIIKGTELFETAQKAFNWDKPFYDNDKIKELSNLLGFNVDKIIGVYDRCLALTVVPKEYKNQFKVNQINGFYLAKKNSDLNKKFLTFIKKYNIQRTSVAEISLEFPFNTINQFHKVFDRYFLSLKEKIDTKYLNVFQKDKRLEEISEPDFLRLKAEYLEKKKTS